MFIEVPSREAMAMIMVMPDLESPGQHSCSISMPCDRSPIEFVLAASCAIWISNEKQAMIHDNWCFWSEAEAIGPVELARIVRVRGSAELESAFKRILKKLSHDS